jgi:hypothetical protein
VRKTIYILLLLTITSACNTVPESLPAGEYVKWVENPKNQLKKEKTIGEYKYKIFYKPAEYISLREAVNKGEQDNVKAITFRSEEIKEFFQFNFDIVSADGKTSALKHNTNNEAEFGARINYLVSHAQQDFKLIQGEDTLPCVSYHFERTFGLTQNNTILLSFEKPKGESNDDIQLIFTNRLFNSGDIKFQFSYKTLNNIPRLTL